MDDMGREATRISLNEILKHTAPDKLDGESLRWTLDFTSKEIAVCLTHKNQKHFVIRSRHNPADQVVKACVDECLRRARGR
jgi:hypothetical protein